MIKIAYIIGQLTRHGAEKQLYELLKGIDRKKFHPVVISLSEDEYWGGEIRKLGIDVIEIKRTKSREFSRLFKLIKILKEIKPDITHTYLFSANTYGRVASMITGVPIIIASERNAGELGNDKKRHQVYIDKFLSLISNGIICNSYKCYHNLIDRYGYNPDKVYMVHNGIGFSGIDRETDFNHQESLRQKVIGTVGRLYPNKNQKLFLDMAKNILNRPGNDNTKFMIVGDGPIKDELIQYSEKLGVADNP